MENEPDMDTRCPKCGGENITIIGAWWGVIAKFSCDNCGEEWGVQRQEFKDLKMNLEGSINKDAELAEVGGIIKVNGITILSNRVFSSKTCGVQEAIDLAYKMGGGYVGVPAGEYPLKKGLDMKPLKDRKELP